MRGVRRCSSNSFAYEDFSQREVEEIGFVPSALSEPRGAIHWFDGRCCDHGFRFNRIVEMTTEEGGEARTVKLCKLCCNERQIWQGKQPFDGGGVERDW